MSPNCAASSSITVDSSDRDYARWVQSAPVRATRLWPEKRSCAWVPWSEVESSRAPCIDRKYSSRDVLGAIAEQEFHCVGHILDVDQAPQRAAAHDLLTVLVFERPSHVRIDKAGSDGIYVHSHASHFSCQRSGKGNERGFGGAVN